MAQTVGEVMTPYEFPQHDPGDEVDKRHFKALFLHAKPWRPEYRMLRRRFVVEQQYPRQKNWRG